MLENGIGINEVKVVVGKLSEVAAACVLCVGVRNIVQFDARLRNHFVGHINAVDLTEMRAHGPHQTSGSAADFKRTPRFQRDVRREPFEFAFQITDHVRRGREKFFVVLIAPAEGDVIVSIFARAVIPLGAHTVANCLIGGRVFHPAILSQGRRQTRM